MAIKIGNITPVPSAERTTSGSHELGDWPGMFDEVVAYLDVTAIDTGTTLDVKYQVSPDGGTTWFDHTSFTQITTSTGSERKVLTRPAGVLGKLVWTIVGTSYTFAIHLEGKKDG